MIHALLQIVVVVAAAWLQVTEHSRIIEAKAMNSHIKRVWAAVRTCVFILAALGIGAFAHGNLWTSALYIAASLFLFPALFNPWINKAQGWHRWYLGVTSDWDAWLVSRHTGWSVEDLRDEYRTGVTWFQYAYNYKWAFRANVHRGGRAWFRSCLTLSSILFVVGVILNNS